MGCHIAKVTGYHRAACKAYGIVVCNRLCCVPHLKSGRPGGRLWAAFGLGGLGHLQPGRTVSPGCSRLYVWRTKNYRCLNS
jgi:hypothetical protein